MSICTRKVGQKPRRIRETSLISDSGTRQKKPKRNTANAKSRHRQMGRIIRVLSLFLISVHMMATANVCQDWEGKMWKVSRWPPVLLIRHRPSRTNFNSSQWLRARLKIWQTRTKYPNIEKKWSSTMSYFLCKWVDGPRRPAVTNYIAQW